MTSSPLPGRTRHVNRTRAARHIASDSWDSDTWDSGDWDSGDWDSADDGRRHRDDGTRRRDDDRTVPAQIRRLLASGGTYRSIAAAAGLAPATVHGIAAGRQAPTPHTSRALATVTSATLRRARIDAGGTRLRLRALHVMGHSSARIARALGVREMTIRAITRGDAATVSTALRDAIADLYDTWWDKRAPERNRGERAAATTARRRAASGNWCAGAGLDDDHLDTPGYQPKSSWKPAAGTGTAPDLPQPPGTAESSRPCH